MTAKEAIEVIKMAQAQIEGDYPMDYAAAFDMAIKALEQTMWKPFPENIPELDEDGCSDLLLVSFENFSSLMIGQYREDENGGAWYVGDSDETFTENDVYVNAFMQMPEKYQSDTVKLIIEISKEDREDIGNIHFIREDLKFKIGKAIMNGTPLPKGHGRLIDEDTVSTFDDEMVQALANAPTIIEADKAESEG